MGSHDVVVTIRALVAAGLQVFRRALDLAGDSLRDVQVLGKRMELTGRQHRLAAVEAEPTLTDEGGAAVTLGACHGNSLDLDLPERDQLTTLGPASQRTGGQHDSYWNAPFRR